MLAGWHLVRRGACGLTFIEPVAKTAASSVRVPGKKQVDACRGTGWGMIVEKRSLSIASSAMERRPTPQPGPRIEEFRRALQRQGKKENEGTPNSQIKKDTAVHVATGGPRMPRAMRRAKKAGPSCRFMTHGIDQSASWNAATPASRDRTIFATFTASAVAHPTPYRGARILAILADHPAHFTGPAHPSH